MSLTIKAKIGKKYSLYLPKAVVKALQLKEGERVKLKVVDNRLILEPIQDPLNLALSGKKFTAIEPDQIEAISIEEQSSHVKSSA